MDIRSALAPTLGLLLPGVLRNKFYNESWQKSQIDVGLRPHEEALALKRNPVPYLELHFRITSSLPVPLHIYGASVEIWLGKPIIAFYTYVSDSIATHETREGLRAYTFLNNYQADLLGLGKDDVVVPKLTVNLTVFGRSRLGPIEKTMKASWVTPRILP